MHILEGLIVPGQPGGVSAAERTVIDVWGRMEGVTVRVFDYGSRSPSGRS